MSEPVPSYEEIRAMERGEIPHVAAPKATKAASDNRRSRLAQVVGESRREAADFIPDNRAGTALNDLLQLGASGEVPPLTIGGLAVLELMGSPFLAEPVNGQLTITTMDTARAVAVMANGLAGVAPLLSALAMEKAATELERDTFGDATHTAVLSAPLRIRAAEMRGQWDSQALVALEQAGKTKTELDTELLVRIKDIIAELGALR